MCIKRASIFASILFASVLGISAQSLTAPIKWERYRIAERGVSVMFPKLPIVEDSSDPCRELERRNYYAYADGTVYELVIAAKSGSKPPNWCEKKVRFDEKLLSARLEELRSGKAENVETPVRRFERQALLFNDGFSARLVLPDLGNDRWIELAVHASKGRELDQGQFFDSIDIKGPEGREIGAGAMNIMGDPPLDRAIVPDREPPGNQLSEKNQPLQSLLGSSVCRRPGTRKRHGMRK